MSELSNTIKGIYRYALRLRPDSPFNGANVEGILKLCRESGVLETKSELASSTGLAPDDRAWLVEKGLAYAPDYLTINKRHGVWAWTKSHECALRFARKQDAELAATLVGGVERIAEHSWGPNESNSPTSTGR